MLHKERQLTVGIDLNQDDPDLQHVVKWIETDTTEEAARIFCEETWEPTGWTTTRGDNRFIDDFVQVSAEPAVWSDKYSCAQIFVISEDEIETVTLDS